MGIVILVVNHYYFKLFSIFQVWESLLQFTVKYRVSLYYSFYYMTRIELHEDYDYEWPTFYLNLLRQFRGVLYTVFVTQRKWRLRWVRNQTFLKYVRNVILNSFIFINYRTKISTKDIGVCAVAKNGIKWEILFSKFLYKKLWKNSYFQNNSRKVSNLRFL